MLCNAVNYSTCVLRITDVSFLPFWCFFSFSLFLLNRSLVCVKFCSRCFTFLKFDVNFTYYLFDVCCCFLIMTISSLVYVIMCIRELMMLSHGFTFVWFSATIISFLWCDGEIYSEVLSVRKSISKEINFYPLLKSSKHLFPLDLLIKICHYHCNLFIIFLFLSEEMICVLWLIKSTIWSWMDLLWVWSYS